MNSFKLFLESESEKTKVTINNFLDKIYACKTVVGVDELEKFYTKRKLEVDITGAEDIQIRDALSGRKKEIDHEEKEK